MVVIGADTAVVVDGHLLGKPVDDADAARMLRLLSGRTHQVLTGVAVALRSGTAASLDVDVAVTDVTFAPLERRATSTWYVASGEPIDKAGRLRRPGPGRPLRHLDLEGSPDNVIGLPLDASPLGCSGRPGLEPSGSVSRPS